MAGGEQWVTKPKAIRRLRNNKLWTQGQLAIVAGVAKFTIERAERGEHPVTLGTMQKLCKALKCKPDEIAMQREQWELTRERG